MVMLWVIRDPKFTCTTPVRIYAGNASEDWLGACAPARENLQFSSRLPIGLFCGRPDYLTPHSLPPPQPLIHSSLRVAGEFNQLTDIKCLQQCLTLEN